MSADILDGKPMEMDVAQLGLRVTVRCHEDTNTLAVPAGQGEEPGNNGRPDIWCDCYPAVRLALRAAAAKATAQNSTLITSDSPNGGTAPAAAGVARYRQRRSAAMP